MKAQAETQAKAPVTPIDQFPSHNSHKPVPNPRGTQTVPQTKPTLLRSPDGRFAPEFRPHPREIKP
jgi:hypothetical protein